MKSILTLSFSIFLFTSCAVKKIPIKGSYPTPPITETTTTKVDSVWSNLIDFIAQKGMTIKIIDRSSGLLITEDYSFEDVYTYEKKKTGQLANPSAYLVTSRIKSTANKEGSIGPAVVLGNWNVRLKPSATGTLINVNITNIRSYLLVTSRNVDQRVESDFDVKTTGVFERMIIENIK